MHNALCTIVFLLFVPRLFAGERMRLQCCDGLIEQTSSFYAIPWRTAAALHDSAIPHGLQQSSCSSAGVAKNFLMSPVLLRIVSVERQQPFRFGECERWRPQIDGVFGWFWNLRRLRAVCF